MNHILKKHTPVRQIIAPIEGKIIDQGLHDGEIRYLVEFSVADGDIHQRWFNENDVEEVK